MQPNMCRGDGLHHAAHATHTGVHGGHSGSILLLVGDDALGREEHTCDRSSVLQRYTRDLCWVDDARSVEVLELVKASVVAEVTFAILDALYDDSTFLTSVGDDLTQGLFDSTADDLDTRRLVFVLPDEAVKGADSTQERRTTTRDGTFFYGSTRSAEGVVDTVLLLLHLDFAGSTDVEDGDTTGEL